MINIRKFRSVKQFTERVKRLDLCLQGIDSFNNDVRESRMLTPGGPPLLSGVESNGAPQQEIVEEVKGPEGGRIDDDMADSEINICSICLDRRIEKVLTCYHAFCGECIEDWRSRDPTCPLCR